MFNLFGCVYLSAGFMHNIRLFVVLHKYNFRYLRYIYFGLYITILACYGRRTSFCVDFLDEWTQEMDKSYLNI